MYFLRCLICNEECQGSKYTVYDFIQKHVHENHSFIQCNYCECKTDFIMTPNVYLINLKALKSYWEIHKCSEMELQDIEYEERELEKEERETVMNEYRAHTERY